MAGITLTSPPHSTSFLQSFSGGDINLLFSAQTFSFLPLSGNKIARKQWCIDATANMPPPFVEEVARVRKLREAQNKVKIKKRVPLRPGRISGPLPVPDHIPKPSYVGSIELPELSTECQIHDSEGISGMRAACQLAAQALDLAGTLVRPSVTTNEIDKAVHSMIIEAGGYPSQFGFCGFPKSVCTSVNECVCHGIPDTRQLQEQMQCWSYVPLTDIRTGEWPKNTGTQPVKEYKVEIYDLSGDIITIDVAVFLNGFHGTTSRTFLCGQVNELVQRLVQVTDTCLERGIASCKDGALYKKIGKRMSEHVANYDFNLVERFVGHGIGPILHSEPLILYNRNDNPGRMVEGQTFTIGPTLTMGSTECVTWDDGWTTLTSDGSRAAKFEHTVLITKTGVEVLTKL